MSYRARRITSVSGDDEWAAWEAAREAEDAAEWHRYTSQRNRADLSQLPATGHWVVEVTMQPNPCISPECAPQLHEKASSKEAVRFGMQMACKEATRAVRVADPNGAIAHSYDREGNFWLYHPHASDPRPRPAKGTPPSTRRFRVIGSQHSHTKETNECSQQ